RAHPYRPVQIAARRLRLAVMLKGQADISIRGCEVRIEIERGLELVHGMFGIAVCESKITERHVSPRVVLIKVGCATCKLYGKGPIGFYPPHMGGDEKDKCQHALSGRIMRMVLNRLKQDIDGLLALLGT